MSSKALNTRKLRVTLGGPEVAKWWRRMLGDKHGMDWDKSRGFFPVGGSFPIYKDAPPFSVDHIDVPYLGEDTYVELRVAPNAIPLLDTMDMGQVAIAVIRLLQREDVPIGQCSKLRIEIEEEDG